MKFIKLILIFFIVFCFKIKPMEELAASYALADTELQDEDYKNIQEYFGKIKSFILSKWYKEALSNAMYANDLIACEELLKKGADPNSTFGFNGCRPPTSYLCSYIRYAYASGDIIKLLIKYGADVNYNSGYETPLMEAVDRHFGLRSDLVKILIEKGANPNTIIYYRHYKSSVLKYRKFRRWYKTYLFKNKYKKTAKEKLESVLDICNLPKDLHNIIFNYYIDKNITIDKMQKDLNIK